MLIEGFMISIALFTVGVAVGAGWGKAEEPTRFAHVMCWSGPKKFYDSIAEVKPGYFIDAVTGQKVTMLKPEDCVISQQNRENEK